MSAELHETSGVVTVLRGDIGHMRLSSVTRTVLNICKKYTFSILLHCN